MGVEILTWSGAGRRFKFSGHIKGKDIICKMPKRLSLKNGRCFIKERLLEQCPRAFLPIIDAMPAVSELFFSI